MTKWVKAASAKFRALRHFTVMQQEKTTITPHDDLTIEDAMWTEFEESAAEVCAAECVQASSVTQGGLIFISDIWVRIQLKFCRKLIHPLEQIWATTCLNRCDRSWRTTHCRNPREREWGCHISGKGAFWVFFSSDSAVLCCDWPGPRLVSDSRVKRGTACWVASDRRTVRVQVSWEVSWAACCHHRPSDPFNMSDSPARPCCCLSQPAGAKQSPHSRLSLTEMFRFAVWFDRPRSNKTRGRREIFLDLKPNQLTGFPPSKMLFFTLSSGRSAAVPKWWWNYFLKKSEVENNSC